MLWSVTSEQGEKMTAASQSKNAEILRANYTDKWEVHARKLGEEKGHVRQHEVGRRERKREAADGEDEEEGDKW